VRDAQRGARPAPPGAPNDPWGSRPEVEELPAQPVVPRGTSRLGLGGTIAVVGVVVLLAAGFGVLGGRPEATPVPTRGGAAVASTAPVPTPFPGTPAVTPWIECAESPSAAPEITLQINGQAAPGYVEVLVRTASEGHVVPSPARPGRSPATTEIEVPADVITQVWVEGGACAVQWRIGLRDDAGGVVTLDYQPNELSIPEFAAQNRFALAVAPHAGADYDLVAELVFETMTVRARWRISIPALELPVAVVHTASGPVAAVEGCDVTLTLGNGWSEALSPCVDDVGEPPVESAVVHPGERLEFRLEGWGAPDAGLAVCGRLNGPSFVAVPVPGCLMDSAAPAPFVFDAPHELGRWIVALSACASQAASLGVGQNRICGTWYASIHVQS
jgi:hypothetical protein